MKKIDVVNSIVCIINEHDPHTSGEYQAVALRVLSYLEDIGMLPPPCSVTIKEGKHTPTERKWDDETK